MVVDVRGGGGIGVIQADDMQMERDEAGQNRP